MSHLALTIIVAFIMLPILGFAFIPMLPVLPLLFLITLAFAFFGNFVFIGGVELLVLAVLVIMSVVVDQSAGILGARYGGASRQAFLWGFVGLIIGSFLFPPLGGFMGLFLGVFVVELYKTKRGEVRALRAASSALLGSAVGVVVTFFIGLAFIGLFVFFSLN